MSPEQCRAARAWLNWTQQDLARRAKVSLSTVQGFEKGETKPIPATTHAMRLALEAHGIEFIEYGIRLSQTVRQRNRRTELIHISDMHTSMSQAEFEKIATMILKEHNKPMSSHELYNAFYEKGYRLAGSKPRKNFFVKVSRAKNNGVLCNDPDLRLKAKE
jgi:transcriptional regulator with XRE-family HTH domain